MNFNKNDKIISDIFIYDNNGIGHNYKYLLDTGSDITFISEKIFNSLKFDTTSKGKTKFGNNVEKEVKLTTVNLTFSNHNKYIFVQVGVIPNKNDFDVIIGMDIISYCNIQIYTNNNGYIFNLELPLCK